MAVSFGDIVRFLTTPETAALGVAERIGQVYGITTPTVTGVEVIGRSAEDCAINVHLPEYKIENTWFAPTLLEFIDHAHGTEIVIGDKCFVRSLSGEWIERN